MAIKSNKGHFLGHTAKPIDYGPKPAVIYRFPFLLTVDNESCATVFDPRSIETVSQLQYAGVTTELVSPAYFSGK